MVVNLSHWIWNSSGLGFPNDIHEGPLHSMNTAKGLQWLWVGFDDYIHGSFDMPDQYEYTCRSMVYLTCINSALVNTNQIHHCYTCYNYYFTHLDKK